MMDIQELLDTSDFFRSMPPAARRTVASICVPRVLRKREVLFMEGEKGHAMYLQAQGVVQLSKSSPDGKEVVIKLVRPGEIFAEVILYERDTFPVSACALTSALVFRLPRKQFDGLLAEEGFRRDFIAVLLSKQRYLTEQIFRLSALDVEQRFFQFLRDQYGEREEYAIDISKRDIAAAIDALPETLSRLLLKLRDQGSIAWDGERLVLPGGFWKDRQQGGTGVARAGPIR